MVRPLHFQDSLSKIPLLQKIQQAARMAPEVTKERAAEDLQKQDEVKAKAAKETAESEKSIIGDKNPEDRKQKASSRKRRRGKKVMDDEANDAAQDETESGPSGRIIDLFA